MGSIDSSMDINPGALARDLLASLADEPNGSADVPASFLCPISLEPMVDPVTLCTGQTYERANIQRWFDGRHFTCPTTMLTIYDLSLTPNHTLRELIEDWYAHHGIIGKFQLEDIREVSSLLEEVRTNKKQSRNKALKVLSNLVEGDEKVKIEIVQTGGMSALLSQLDLLSSPFVNSEVLSIFVTLPLNEENKKLLMTPVHLSAIIGLLHEGSIDTKVKAAKLIFCLITGNQDRRNRIGTNLSVMAGLLSLLHEKTSSSALLSAFHVLQVLCSTSNQIRLLAARSGAVLPLVNLLSHPNYECVEQSLTILELLSTTREGCSTINEYDKSIPNIVAVITKISEICNEYAISLLEALCKSDMDKAAVQAVKAGVVVKLLLIIQSTCCGRMKKKALNLIKLLRHNILVDAMLISDTQLSQTMS
ncbi:hypothetical protein O6H91_06G128600 [Diphasiastrum complanatum]|uniref:Uncharacterized protein n=2 Tax=Diphasiastrum complanatum TaxID=34168 RepID=A0ACC2DIT9_DIPCM|nr:hypothetical protein O6H91_06G128100 [Diphasiastrum complanatum]KAJ7554157.1 hypothetical protein O6H91_06G128600 [Diphasiastrum complanatum]